MLIWDLVWFRLCKCDCMFVWLVLPSRLYSAAAVPTLALLWTYDCIAYSMCVSLKHCACLHVLLTMFILNL